MRLTERPERRSRISLYATFALLVILGAAATACDRESALGPDRPAEPPSRDALGLVEITITGLGTDHASARAVSAADVADLERMRALRTGGVPANDASSIATMELELPADIDLGGDGTIQLAPVTTGSFTYGERGAGGMRYLYATFRVRNAQSDGTAYDTPRQNLTFLGAADAGTLEETAISSLLRFDGSTATVPATGIIPTGSVILPGGNDTIQPAAADVLQVLTEAEVAAVIADAPAGVTTVFPYGFVVRNPSTPGSRTLVANPAPDQFDGLVTFAFRVPLAATAAEDPYSITAVFLAVDDTETRVTESLEEQGTNSVQSAADALASSAVTLLGNSNTVIAGHGIRRICRVRTAGTDPSAPTATMVNVPDGCTAGAVSVPDHVRVVDIDAADGGDGVAWSSAFRYLQDALTCVRDDSGAGGACEDVTEVWVAEGTYFPDEGAGQTDNDRNASFFELIEGLQLYGGFAGVEYSRDQRDWRGHSTVLSGDLDGDPTMTGNANRIVIIPSDVIITRATVLDGFTISDAYSSGANAALECVALGTDAGCSATLRNLVMRDNTGENGVVLVVANDGAVAEVLFDHVLFTGNHGTSSSGMYVFSSLGTANVEVVHSDFIDNRAWAAGAAYIRSADGSVDVSFRHVRFHGDTAMNAGGTMGPGGAVRVEGATASFINTEFWGNVGEGSAVYGATGAAVTLVNSTVANNSGVAAAVSLSGGSTLTIHNSILYGNSPANVLLTSATGTIANTLIDGCPVGVTCSNMVGGDPGFVDLLGGDLRISGSSPATDSGNNAMLPGDPFDFDDDGDTSERTPFDLGGLPRIVDWSGAGTAIVDMGAHERQ